MDRQPVLTGERLEMRPLVESDWDALFAIAANPDLWAMHPLNTRWQEPVFRAFFDDALANKGALVAIERATGAIVASSRFQEYLPDEGGEVEIGWTFLTQEKWGSGLNVEMKRMMLAHALRFVERVVFRVGEHNLRSRRAVEKIGGRLTADVEVLEHDGQQLVHVVYEIRRADFANGPLSA